MLTHGTDWSLSPFKLGAIASCSLAGMTIGAIGAGVIRFRNLFQVNMPQLGPRSIARCAVCAASPRFSACCNSDLKDELVK